MIPKTIIEEMIKRMENNNCNLESLKDLFQYTINSKRRYSLITTNEEFISVILKRKNYIQNIKLIGNILKDDYFETVNLQDVNEYSFYRDNKYVNNNLNEAPPILPEPVIDLIANAIGKKSLLLARKLGLREGEIDKLEKEYHNDQEMKARKILELFQQKCRNKKILQTNLLRGLIDSRRIDLKEEVENLF